MRPRKGASEVKKRKKLQRSLKDKITAAQKLVSPNGKDLCNAASNVGSLYQSQNSGGKRNRCTKRSFLLGSSVTCAESNRQTFTTMKTALYNLYQ
ncbi:putative protein isoform X5 [Capsicum chacoense]